MPDREVYTILSHHVPTNVTDYCFELWRLTPFEFKLSRKRESKVGDFTFNRHSKVQRITLNRDLNPYLFLITFVHEVAHLRVYLHYGSNHVAHGSEWKRVFQNLMLPLLNDNVFPESLLPVLSRHMQKPKASTFADGELTIALRKFDDIPSALPMVSELPEGSVFKLHGRYFKKGKLKRTRVICREIKTNRLYLVPAEATVSDVQLSLL
jgi:hypothetical protein